MKKKLLSLLLVAGMVFSGLPFVPGYADVVRAEGETEYDYKISDTETLKYVAVDNLIYALKTEDNTAVLAGYQYAKDSEGYIDYENYRGGTTVNIPSTITYGDARYTVDQIGGHITTEDGDQVDFPGLGFCLNIEKVVMPDTIKTIGSQAFEDCSALKEVTFSKSLLELGYAAFSGCKSLEKADLPDSITTFGGEVFSHCEALKSVHIPASINEIDTYDFYDCVNLENITLGDGNTNGYSVDKNGALVRLSDYDDVYVIVYPLGSPNTVFDVYEGMDAANADCLIYAKNLKSFTVTDNEEYQVDDEGVLYDDSSLICYPMAKTNTSYTVMDGIRYITSSAFSSDVSLTELVLPASVSSANLGWEPPSKLQKFVVNEDNDFYSASSDGVLLSSDGKKIVSFPAGRVGSYTVPSTITSIGDSAFAYTGLSEITVPSSVSEMEIGAFSHASVKKVNLSEGIESIPASAFAFCENLETVTIPSTIKMIDGNAFQNCSALTQISLPESLTVINRFAFDSCSGLTEITIPGSVNSIGEYAFSGCDNLKKVTINSGTGSSVERTIGEGAFYRNKKLVIYSIPADITIDKDAIGVLSDSHYTVTDILESNVTESPTPTLVYVSYTDKNNITWTPTIYGVAGSPAEAYAKATNGGVKFSTEAAPSILPVDSESNNGSGNGSDSSSTSGSDGAKVPDTTSGSNTNVTPSGGGSSGGGGGGTAGTSTTTKNADGSTTTTTKVSNANGTITTTTTTNTDGTKVVVKTEDNKDGSKKVTQTSTKADKSQTVAVISTTAAGKTTVTIESKDAAGATTASASYTASGKKLTLAGLTANAKSVTIPATVKVGDSTYKVTKIGAKALANNKIITKVTIGKNVTSIGKSAFANDSKIKTITIKGKVTSVGKNAFKDINKKATITVKASKANFKKIKKAIKKLSGIPSSAKIKRA